MGVKKIYLVGITPTPRDRFHDIRPDFYKVALGAERSVPWEYLSIAHARKKMLLLKKQGYYSLAVEQHKKSLPYFKLAPKYSFERLVLLVGNEVGGLPPKVLNSVDKILEIPMHGKLVRHLGHIKNLPLKSREGKESLNVSVAFGVAVFGLKYR